MHSGDTKMTERQSALFVGAGPGLGAALVQRFAAAGMNITATARSAGKAAAVAEAASAVSDSGSEIVGLQADATNEAEINDLFATHTARWGAPGLVIYNAGAFMKASIVGATADDFRRCWEANCFGGFIVAKAAAERMVEHGQGTILFSGATASKRGGAQFFNLAVGKAGLLALAQSMARELGPQGIHVAHVVIDGQIMSERYAHLADERPPEGLLDPAAIAETYWQLHCQPRSAWTLETELRPWVEKF